MSVYVFEQSYYFYTTFFIFMLEMKMTDKSLIMLIRKIKSAKQIIKAEFNDNCGLEIDGFMNAVIWLKPLILLKNFLLFFFIHPLLPFSLLPSSYFSIPSFSYYFFSLHFSEKIFKDLYQRLEPLINVLAFIA